MPNRATRVIAVVGPTATGKSDLAVALAQRLDGEVVNADSMQLYAGMDIGTAKLTPDERAGVPHHLLDVWPLAKSAAVAQYQSLARGVIDEIASRGKTPIVVGGSGLYLRGALDKLDFPGESPALRAGLYAALDEHGPEALHARLAEDRFTTDDLSQVLAAAPDVIDLLDRDDRWWAPWDDWTPADLPVES